MQELKISRGIKNIIEDFIHKVKEIYQDQLVSIILYGSAASGEFINKRSNLNLLVVLTNADLANLKKTIPIMGKHKIIKPLFLTESCIDRSLDIFPIEFLDLQENYAVLFGKDILKDLYIDTKNLRFQCEQELKAKLISLRQSYLSINKNKSALQRLLLSAFTSILHILRNVLRLKGKKSVPYLKKELLNELALELRVDLGVWEKILAAQQRKIKLNDITIEEIFNKFIEDLDSLVDIVDKL